MVDEIKAKIKINVDTQIGILSGVGGVVFLYLVFKSKSQATNIMEPLNNLIEDAESIENQEMDIDLSKGFVGKIYF